MPDWEFILWDKNCLKDLNSDWVNEAYSTKKYAFAADYIRLYAVNKFGGFYLDSDVEVLKNFAPLLDSPYIFALENEIGDIEAATFGSGIPAEGSGIRRVLTPLPERLNSGTA